MVLNIFLNYSYWLFLHFHWHTVAKRKIFLCLVLDGCSFFFVFGVCGREHPVVGLHSILSTIKLTPLYPLQNEAISVHPRSLHKDKINKSIAVK